MSKDDNISHNWLKDSFYTTPKFAHQVMSLKQWKETLRATEGNILSCGETWKLKQEYLGGGMRDVTVELKYWKGGKPSKKQVAVS